ncbi:MAG TPA: hypothetical protein VJM51_00325 [Dehalococcoidia bacterium]|nr:hypothetical protein [Dehalococcoidia bacterium]
MPARKGAPERLLRALLEEAAAVGEERLAEVLKDVLPRLKAARTMGTAAVPEDPFVILGVSPTDPLDLVTAVYRLKAKYFHPDNKETGDAAAFKRLRLAHDAVVQAQQRTKRA